MQNANQKKSTFDVDALKIETKAPYVDNGTESIDASRYYTPEFMAQEWDTMWTKSWNCIGRISDISEVGDFITCEILHEKILVVRDESEAIQAFYNVCIHRGNQLVHGDLGHSEGTFSCTYHGWIYALDGSLSHITQAEHFREEVTCNLKGLTKVRCDVWGGFIFVTLDESAPPLLDYLGVIPEHLAGYHFENMVIVSDLEAKWPVNWKTALDNFTESYHGHWVHPQLHSAFDQFHQYDLYENGVSRTLTPYRSVISSLDDGSPKKEALAAIVELDLGVDITKGDLSSDDFIALIEKHRNETSAALGLERKEMADAQIYYSMFPNVILSIHPEALFFIQVLPDAKDPEWCTLKIVLLAQPNDDPAYKIPEYIGAPADADLTGSTRPDTVRVEWGAPGLGGVLEQDTYVVPFVQQAMKSRGMKGLQFGEQEQRIRHNHAEIDRYINGEKW